jgi:hypothetical protein
MYECIINRIVFYFYFVQVPGIGDAGVRDLAAAGITTTYQLLGIFLTLKAADTGSVEHCDKFWYWLKAKVPSSAGHRSGVVLAIAQKANASYPGLYDESAYDATDEST